MSTIDIITPLTKLQETALSRPSALTGEPTPFLEGYLMAIGHAIELAQVLQARVDLQLAHN